MASYGLGIFGMPAPQETRRPMTDNTAAAHLAKIFPDEMNKEFEAGIRLRAPQGNPSPEQVAAAWEAAAAQVTFRHLPALAAARDIQEGNAADVSGLTPAYLDELNRTHVTQAAIVEMAQKAWPNLSRGEAVARWTKNA